MPKTLLPLPSPRHARVVAWVVLAALQLAVPPTRAESRSFDVLIRGGTVYDGSGGAPRRADVALPGDRVEAVGDLAAASARTVLDATGLAVAPGFVNVLSWATEDLLADPRSQSDIRQGVTTETFGEGESYGPWSEPMKVQRRAMQGDFKYEIAWTTLGEYLQLLERRGVAPNVASFVGSGTIREHVVGLDDGRPSPAQLGEMRELVRRAMEDGARGVGSSLICAPDAFNSPEDLVELAKVAAGHGGRYITHMRSEGDRLLEAVEKTIGLARAAGIPAEIYHLKAAGEANWPKLARVIEKVEAARRVGGWSRTFERIRDGETRARMLRETREPAVGWENVCQLTGSPERIRLVAFRSESLKPLTGKTLADVAAARGRSPEETILDLVVEDESRIGVVLFMISEENVRRQVLVNGVPVLRDGEHTGALPGRALHRGVPGGRDGPPVVEPARSPTRSSP